MQTQRRTSPGVRWDLLASAPFLVALALLAINDWILKPAFHNALTGKLSDFAGLFACMIFLAALVPRYARIAALGLAVGFAWWKSALAEPAIAAWNSLPLFDVGRVVDPGDLIALLVLPLALRLAASPARTRTPGHALRFSIVTAAVFVFAATSAPRTVTPYDATYRFPMDRDELRSLAMRAFPLLWADGSAGTIDIVFDGSPRCADAVWAKVGFDGDTASSALRLLEVMHSCSDDDAIAEVLRTDFEANVVLHLRRLASNDSLRALARAAQIGRRPSIASDEHGTPSLLVTPLDPAPGDTLHVITAAPAVDVGYDVCDLTRERLESGVWVALPPKDLGKTCAPREHTLPARDRARTDLVVDPVRWPAGVYRLRRAFRVRDERVVVYSEPIVVQPG